MDIKNAERRYSDSSSLLFIFDRSYYYNITYTYFWTKLARLFEIEGKMENSKIPVEGHENDKIIISTKRHIASLIGAMFLIFVMIILPILILSVMLKMTPEFLSGYTLNFLVIIISIYYLVVATVSLTIWVSYYYNIFIVTENEILDISQEGIFDRRVSEVSLLRIQDVSARIKGFWPTLFGYGDVVAESAGENTRTYIIDSIPHPVEVANKILALHTEHIQREERAAEIITAEGDLRSHKLGWPAREDATDNQAHQEEKVCEPCPVCLPEEQGTSPVQPAQPPSQFEEPANPQSIQPDSQNTTQGEVKSDDLNSGGEIKL